MAAADGAPTQAKPPQETDPMSTNIGIILALALGSIVLFSTIFLVMLLQMRSRWDQLGDPKQTQDKPDH